MDLVHKIVEELGLVPHPEGGFYKEVYRSKDLMENGLNVMTSIYFLLTSDNVSKFHRIISDEIWFHHQGSPIVVHTLGKDGHQQNIVGSDVEKGLFPQFLVPKNTIFGTTVLEEHSYALVSCVVAPGFDFKDFELFTKQQLMEDYADFEQIIDRLT